MYGCFVLCTGTGYRTAHTAYCQSLPDAPEVSILKRYSSCKKPRHWQPMELQPLIFVVLEHLDGQPRKDFKSTVMKFQDLADGRVFRVPASGPEHTCALDSISETALTGFNDLHPPLDVEMAHEVMLKRA
eukprot:jgi/Chrzof1/2162/Cz11g04170.t1